MPSPDPVTVTVVPTMIIPRFTTDMDESAGDWYESVSVSELAPWPTVIATRIVLMTPIEDAHTTTVFESHTVASQPVPPLRAMLLRSANPNPLPTMVVVVEPIATLSGEIDDSPESYDTVSVCDPATTPTVTPTRSVCAVPEVIRHTMTVSETQP
eukprot:413102-Rhodomonas_salina.1